MDDPRDRGGEAALFATTLALSAFLLFAVQPLFGRLALPRLGGAPAVWNTAMVFFQTALLAGYAYAHGLARRFQPRAQLAIHASVLALAALALPLAIPADLAPPESASPAPWLFGLMATTIGPPFLALAATAPLLQSWFARAVEGRRDPYPLYAASNAGSFVALLAYPLAIEPNLGLAAQAGWWALGYGGLVALILACGAFAVRAPAPPAPPIAAPGAGRARERLAWIALSAIPSSLLLGVTSHITTDIAAIPLLWIAPLALYLLTFVAAFGWPRGRDAAAYAAPYAAAILAFVACFPGGVIANVATHLAAFTALALHAHMELAQRRPPPARLTEFYLCVSAGGALGGAATALIAPMAFTGVWEYPLAVAAACLIAAPGTPIWPRARKLLALAPLAVLAALMAAARGLVDPSAPINVVAVILVAAVAAALVFSLRRRPGPFAIATAIALLFAPNPVAQGERLLQARSFFGVSRVGLDTGGGYRLLHHGTTLHNAEAVADSDKAGPLTYYTRDGPVGRAFAALGDRLAGGRIGAVGLGAGAIACYARQGQSWTFFEIDPLVVRIARDPTLFGYVTRCAPAAEMRVGDGRLTLAREPDGSFALLVVDAFSSDSIPVHLLTREALRLYLAKLAPDGVLLLHLSNRYLDLIPVTAAIAAAEGATLRLRQHVPAPDAGPFRNPSVWAAIARAPEALGGLDAAAGWAAPPAPTARAWTDDYADVLSAFRR